MFLITSIEGFRPGADWRLYVREIPDPDDGFLPLAECARRVGCAPIVIEGEARSRGRKRFRRCVENGVTLFCVKDAETAVKLRRRREELKAKEYPHYIVPKEIYRYG